MTLGSLFRKFRLARIIGTGRARRLINPFYAVLPAKSSLLEIGSGGGHIAMLLVEKGFRVTPLDVTDLSAFKEMIPILYNGKNIPFPNSSFDVATLITVLNHVPEPEIVLEEAIRVAPIVIVVEDTYTSPTQKWLTFVMDSVTNLEFFGHPHSNRTSTQWMETFEKLGIDATIIDTSPFWLLFESTTFMLHRRK